ncbi:MAG: hypothetical protein JO257_16450 [Deltaproteobacteria bacterium]|nr:hypothetical protein [Deltaproteobacteria bacterium]
MGSKLAVLAWTVVGLAGAAYADKAGDLMKKGIDQYKAGKYPEAAATLQQVYDLDHKPETLFALAQAQRLAGDCPSAAANYHKVLDQISDMNTAKLVEQSLALCEPPKPESKPEPAAPPPAPAPPQIITKTVVQETSKTDVVAASLFGVGMLSLGAAGGLYLAASSNADAADKAATLDAHNSLSDKAKSEDVGMMVAAGVGVVAIGYAVFRWTHGSEAKTEVAAVPTNGGGALWVSGRF